MNKNSKIEKQKLTTNESNKWQLLHANDANYHNEKLDNFLGQDFKATIIKKNNKEYLVTKTRYGGFYCLGSIIEFLMGLIVFAAIIFNIFSIKDFTTENIISLIITAIFGGSISIFLIINAFKSLKEEIKEKLDIRRRKKNGENVKFMKEKMGLGGWIHRILIILFCVFMGFAACMLIKQELGF